ASADDLRVLFERPRLAYVYLPPQCVPPCVQCLIGSPVAGRSILTPSSPEFASSIPCRATRHDPGQVQGRVRRRAISSFDLLLLPGHVICPTFAVLQNAARL